MAPRSTIDLGEVQLDLDNHTLVVGDERTQLRPKTWSLLIYLVENPGRIVGKDELLDHVWADTVVGDAVLKACVRELRQALRDDPKAPRFIETVHRRGYRFLVTVEVQDVSESVPATPPAPPPVATNDAEHHPVAEPALAETCLTLLGREGAWRLLVERYQAALAGAKSTVFVSATLGLGKTALVTAFGDSLVGVRVARGDGREQFGTGEAYAPFLEALSGLCRQEPNLADRLRRIAPTWLLQLPWLHAEQERERLQQELLGATGERMQREWIDLCYELSQDRPLVLILEDLHWADDATWELVDALASRPGPTRLLLVVTLRSQSLIDGCSGAALLPRLRLREDVATLELAPLERTDLAELIQREMGCAPSHDLLDWFEGRSEGNSLYAVRLLGFLRERGALVVRAQRCHLDEGVHRDRSWLPESLRAVIERQLSQLSQEQAALLEVAALAGYRLSAAAVAAALEVEIEEAEAQLDVVVRDTPFLAADGIARFPGGLRCARYRFQHALYQDVCAARIGPGRRRRLQLRLAQSAERVFGDESADMAGALLEHFLDGGEIEKGLEYTLLAARKALGRFSAGEAIRALKAAEPWLEELEDSARGEWAWRLAFELGRSRRSAGDMTDATEDFARSAREAMERGAAEHAARAHLLAASAASWFDKSTCLDHVQAARDLAEQLPAAIVDHVEGWAAYWRLLWEGPSGGGGDALRKASVSLQLAGLEGEASEHVGRLAFYECWEGRYREAYELASQGRRAAAEAGEAFDALLCDFFAGWAALFLAPDPAFSERLRSAREEAVRNGHHAWGCFFQMLEGGACLERGETREASQHVRAALDAMPSEPPRALVELTGRLHVLVLVDSGELEAAREQVQQLSEDTHILGWMCERWMSLARARLANGEGRYAEAKSEAQALLERAASTGDAGFEGLARIELARALRGEGRGDAAEEQWSLAEAAGGRAPGILQRLQRTRSESA